MRGSPHAHCLLWVKDVPKLDRNFDEEVCAFIDTYITAVLPEMSQQNAQLNRINEKFTETYAFRLLLQHNLCRFAFPKGSIYTHNYFPTVTLS